MSHFTLRQDFPLSVSSAVFHFCILIYMFTGVYSQRLFTNLCLIVNTLQSNLHILKENSSPQCVKMAKPGFFRNHVSIHFLRWKCF